MFYQMTLVGVIHLEYGPLPNVTVTMIYCAYVLFNSLQSQMPWIFHEVDQTASVDELHLQNIWWAVPRCYTRPLQLSPKFMPI